MMLPKNCLFFIFFITMALGSSFDQKLDDFVAEALQNASESLLLIPRPEKLVITTARADTERTDLAKLIFTCQRSNPDCFIVAILISWTEEQIQPFKEQFDRCIFVNIDDSFDTQHFQLKVSILMHAYLNFEAPFLWLDVDRVVLRSLDSIFAKLKKSDFCATVVPWKKGENRFCSSVVGVGLGKLAGNFALKTYYFANHYDGRGSQEQLGMYLAYKELLSKGIDFQQLTIKENCLYYFPGVIICTAFTDDLMRVVGLYREWKEVEGLFSRP